MSGSGAAVLLLFGLVSWSRGQETIKNLTGSDVTFKADVTARPTEISWFQGTNKIVDLEEGSEPFFYRLRERTIPDLTQGTLLLRNVSPADSGSYRARLLIQGSYSDVSFSLQVFDPVCQAVIQNSTQENNVTLRCTCSAKSNATTTRYQWYNGGGRHVSDLQNITIQKEDQEQRLLCNASNEVSWTNATITVPPKENTARSHTATICGILVGVILLLIVIVIYVKNRKKCSKSPVQNPEAVKLVPEPTGGSKSPVQNPEAVKLVPEPTGEPLIPAVISLEKPGEILMSIELQSPELSLERLSVQRDMLKIMGVKDEDYAQYKAEVHLRDNTTATHTFLCKSAQNGEIRPCDDAETELVHPDEGELKMKIPSTEDAERIVWSKDGAEILAVSGSAPSSAGLVLYKGALSTGLVLDGDETRWEDVARPPGTFVQYVFRLKDAALNSGRITLYPVIVERENQITWKKNQKALVTWEAGESPEYPGGEALHLESGRLTLRNLKDCSGEYTMEAEGPETTRQEFRLTVQPAS